MFPDLLAFSLFSLSQKTSVAFVNEAWLTQKSLENTFSKLALQLYPSCKIQLKLCTPQKNLQKVKIQFPVNNHIGGKLLASITFLKIENSFSLVEWSSLCCPLIL